jgi:methionyl-tRNA formyltransferase
MKIVFFGNHTVGVETLKTLQATEQVVGVVAHVHDPEDGVRYRSVYEYSARIGMNVIRTNGKDSALETFIKSAQPDLLWVTDYKYLLPKPLLSITPKGVVNLHPGLLPKYRGRAPINWAILNGETTIGLSAHFVDEGMDTGDIIEQMCFDLKEEQDVGNALQILYPLYAEITQRVLKYFKSGSVPRRPQDHLVSTTFPARRPEDGLIYWGLPAGSIRNLIRAVAAPYPGAFTFYRGRKLVVWKSQLACTQRRCDPPGMVLKHDSRGIVVQCNPGSILLTHIEPVPFFEAGTISQGELLGR